MKVSELISIYIEFKQSLGMKFLTESRALRAFCRMAGDVEPENIALEIVNQYLNGRNPYTRSWHWKFDLLKGLYRFAILRGYATASPVPAISRPRPPIFIPYIYTTSEIRQLIKNAPSVCKHGNSYLEGKVFRMLLLILWGTGLRLGEVLRLRLSDVDLKIGVLTIHDTKFSKTRMVPMDPRLTSELAKYMNVRRRRYPRGNDSRIFPRRDGKPLSHSTVERCFRKLCKTAGVRRRGGARCQPRLHDLRHSFATSRLVSWYQQGLDVQSRLFHLSVYLGHGNIESTQVYIAATPELLREASNRFSDYAEMEVRDDRI